MKKKTQVLVLVIIVLVCSISVFLISIFNEDKKDAIDNTNDNVVDNTTETIEENSSFDDLKNKLGNGSNGDVVKVEESINNDGNRTYTLTTSDGDSHTIVIRKVDDDDVIPDDSDDDVDEEDDPGEQEQPYIPPMEFGTAYEEFLALSNEDQVKFYYSFENASEFFKWYNAALEEYKSLNPTIVVGEDEVIDFSN